MTQNLREQTQTSPPQTSQNGNASIGQETSVLDKEMSDQERPNNERPDNNIPDNNIPDKEAIRAEWEATRKAFHQLLNEIPPEAWRRKSKSTRWNIAELCAHIVHDVEGVPMFVDRARRGKDFLNLPSPIVNPMNWFLTKMMGRKATPESLAKKYEEGYAAALKVLDEVKDDEWQRGANFFGEGYWTIEIIFHNSPHHFEEHAAQVRESL